jgi:hypothetical protein
MRSLLWLSLPILLIALPGEARAASFCGAHQRPLIEETFFALSDPAHFSTPAFRETLLVCMNGIVVRSSLTTDLDCSRPFPFVESRIVRARVSPAALAQLTAALVTGRVGLLTDCQIVSSDPEVSNISARKITWFGVPGRSNTFMESSLAFTAPPCTQQALQIAVELDRIGFAAASALDAEVLDLQ